MVGTPTMAALPITEEAGVILAASVIQQKDFSHCRYTLTADMPESYDAGVNAWLLEQYPDAKTLALIGIDDESGHVAVARLNKTVPALRPALTVVSVDYYARGATDFTALATKIASLNPDVLMDGNVQGGSFLGLQLKALHQAGYKGAFLVNSTLIPKEIIDACGDSKIVEGLYGIVPADFNPNPNELVKEFKEAYVKKYGVWDAISYTFTNQFYLLVNAIKKANSLERDDVMKAVEKLKFETLMGEVIMVKRPDLGSDRYCAGVIPFDMGVMKNGQLVWKASISAKEILPRLPKLFGYEGQWGW
jgi:ABC-type branched-subunit amino acid transport system substrate-binding protein